MSVGRGGAVLRTKRLVRRLRLVVGSRPPPQFPTNAPPFALRERLGAAPGVILLDEGDFFGIRAMLDRLLAAARTLELTELKSFVIQAEALAAEGVPSRKTRKD